MAGDRILTIEYKDSKRIVALSSDVAQTPTFEDDFSTDNFDTQGTKNQVNTGTGVIDFDFNRDGSNHKTKIDTTLGNEFVVRWTQTWDNIGFVAGNPVGFIGLGNTAETVNILSTTNDFLGFEMIVDNSGITELRVVSAIGESIFSSNHDDILTKSPTENETLGYEIIRYSDTDWKINVYDSTFTTLEDTTGLLTTASSSLDTTNFMVATYPSSSQTSQGDGTIDNLEIYNGVTSLTNKPTDVQDNSILVEKDTAKRYWFDAGADSNVELTTGAPFVAHATGWQGKAWISELADLPNIGDVVTGGKIYVGTSAGNVRLGLYSDNGSGVPQTLLAETASTAVGSAGAWQEIDFISSYTTTSTDKLHLGLQADSSGSGFGYATNVSLARSEMVTSYGAFPTTFSGTSDNTPADLRAVVERPAAPAWTMQPTYQTDFSSSTGWISVGSGVSVTGGKLDANFTTNADNRIYKDLGFDLEDQFIAQFDYYQGTVASGPYWNMFSFNEDSSITYTNGKQSIGMIIDMGSYALHSRSFNGSAENTNDTGTVSLSANTQFYLTVIRDGTSFKTKVYEDSSRSTQVGSTIESTLSSINQPLRYFHTGYYAGGNSGTAIYNIDNLKVYNGVTSIN